MTTAATPTSPSTPPKATELAATTEEVLTPAQENSAWPLLPVETEIYILPDGRVVVADLPAELAAIVPALGAVEPTTQRRND
ncbi:MAG: hypothetical protein R3C14_28600 [Caldilineaceae bacterium]